MKFESKEITNSTTIQNIINAVNQYVKDIMSEFKDPTVIEITSVKVDLKNNKVYVMYNDYTEEMKKIQELITKALSIKNEISKEISSSKPDETKLAILYGELSSIDNEYYKITSSIGVPKHIYEVI